jgi:group II intron reverse transcriptase/maturase/CRISPR-associated endonuclease Cas1
VAWHQIKTKNSAGGIDGLSVLEFEKNLHKNLENLLHELQTQTWTPEPYLSVEIPKNESEKRRLGLLSIKDKIVQQAIKNLIEPQFEKLFVNNSYAYRPGRGAVRAIRRANNEIKNKQIQWVAKLDIDNYFDSISHEILFSRLKNILKEPQIQRLIELSLKMGVVSKYLQWSDSTTGVPQGAILSPLMANFYLHPFDQHVISHTKSYIRYADDFLIFATTKEEINNLVQKASLFLEERLKLKLNEPVIAEASDGIPFLGLIVGKNGITISDNKLQQLRARINTIRLQNGVFSKKSLEILQGIEQYYAILLPKSYLLPLDEILKNKINALIELNIDDFPNQKALQNVLYTIPFFSKQNNAEHEKFILDCINYYAEHKKEEKITSLGASAELKNRQLIHQKKIEYQRREGEGAELIVQSFDSFIGKNKQGIVVKAKGKTVKTVPIRMLKHITVLSRGISFSSDAVYHCVENNIPIDFFDSHGKHYASIISPISVENSLWQLQAQMSIEKKAYLASKLIFGKLKNQLHLVKYFHKYHKNENSQLSETYINTEQKIEYYIDQCKHYKLTKEKDYAEKIRSFEAQAAIAYWEYVRQLLADDNVVFEKREQKGATDLFNSMLNWGYSLLYPRVWQAVLGANLNPSIGVLHAYQKGKPVFVYDIIEMFRSQAVDRMVIGLVQKKEPLEMYNNYLNDNTRNLVTQNILERLNRYEKYRKADIQFFEIINAQVRDIAAFIAEETDKFKPYIAKW